MPNVELIALLFVALVPLVALADRLRVAYPIVVVLGGVAIGYIPGIPPIRLAPDVVLVLFLPALVYWESVTAPAQEFLANAGSIVSLAIGLVVATTLAVAGLVHWYVAGLSWAAAVVMGAIVAPTDEVAFDPVASRLGVPRHTLAIVQGESLSNDAVSLVIYAVALGAVAHVGMPPWRVAGDVVWASAGAIIIGVVVARAMIALWHRFKLPELQVLLSLLSPYLAYLPAQRAGASGVLAVVTTGLVIATRAPLVISPRARVIATGFWETLSFLANASIFLLIGLQLHAIVDALHGQPWWHVALEALALNVVIAAVRFAWVYAQAAIANRFRAPGDAAHPQQHGHSAIISWAGIRGGISLAAALALPLRFPHRDLFIFLTFSVIVATLVGAGGTLPWLIRVLRIEDDAAEERDVREATIAVAKVALERLAELAHDGAHAEVINELQRRYQRKIHTYAADAENPKTVRMRERQHAYRTIQTDVLQRATEALVAMRDRGDIDNQALRRVQSEFDLELIRLEDLPAVDDAAKAAEQPA